MDGNAITCPFKFGGDFTMEIYFYLNTADTNYMAWLEMYITNTADWAFDVWAGMGMHQDSVNTSEYWVGQNGNSLKSAGTFPGLIVDGDNLAVFKKTGNIITITLNDEPVASFTLSLSNQIPYYRLFLSAYDDTTAQWKGAYIQKVVIQYEDGNIAP